MRAVHTCVLEMLETHKIYSVDRQAHTVHACVLEMLKTHKIYSVDRTWLSVRPAIGTVAHMTVLSTLDSLCDKITRQQGAAPLPHDRDSAFLDILLESIDSLAYAFLIVPFLYNSQDRLQHISIMFCDIIKSIDQHTSQKTTHKEFLRDTQECLATLSRHVLSEEVAMYV